MATMSFSVPDDVRDRFDAVFEGHNKTAIITTLMLNAIEEEERRRRSLGLVERLRLV
jgi:predicted transcriptional regulator